jgi:hypothetical protein
MRRHELTDAQWSRIEDAVLKNYNKPFEIAGFYQSQLSDNMGGHVFLTAAPTTHAMPAVQARLRDRAGPRPDRPSDAGPLARATGQ